MVLPQMFFLFAATLSVCGLASPSCYSRSTCHSCTANEECYWCPNQKEHSCHYPISFLNSCLIWQNDRKPDQCPAEPAPFPVGPKQKIENAIAEKIIGALLKRFNITGVDPATCVNDVGGSSVLFRDFAGSLKVKQYSSAIKYLGRALTAVSNSVTDCGLQQVQTKIDALAASVRWANITKVTRPFDKGVKIIVGASDLWKDIAAIADAIENKDAAAAGVAVNKLYDDWSSVEKSCKDATECKLIDGLLRVLKVTANDVAPCKEALSPAIADLELGAKEFAAKNYTDAIGQFALGLDVLAKATSSNACGLKVVADAIGDLGPKLKAAVVKAEGSSAVTIIVGSADVYDEIYAAVVDIQRGDFAGAGIQMGALLNQLRASACKSNACVVLQGLLGVLQVGFTDVKACEADVDKAWSSIESLVDDLEGKKWSNAITDLGNSLQALGTSVSACGLQQIGTILEDTATQLHADAVATAIEEGVNVLVKGADVTLDIQKIIVDAHSKQWDSLGRDLGALSDWISGTGCNSFVCHFVEGILGELDMAFVDLKPCEDDLRSAEQDWKDGALQWRSRHPDQAIKYWAAGLNDVSKSVDACGIAEQLKYMEQEANVLGFGNATMLGEVAKILVHGADFYEELYGAAQDFENHDFRAAGKKVTQVMNDLSEWTKGHLCTSNACYVVAGAMEFLSDMEGDFKKCGSDFKYMASNFSEAYHKIVDPKAKYLWFTKNETRLKEGVHDIAMGLGDLASSVQDCHMAEFAAILLKIATKMGVVPEIQWVEDLLKILIDGVQIENEVANALDDWSTGNWVGVGYNLIRLFKTLFTAEEQAMILTAAQASSLEIVI